MTIQSLQVCVGGYALHIPAGDQMSFVHAYCYLRKITSPQIIINERFLTQSLKSSPYEHKMNGFVLYAHVLHNTSVYNVEHYITSTNKDQH